MPEITPSAARSTVTTERSALVADALRCNGRLRLRVHGESMLPSLWPGDVVEIASCSPADLHPGEIVLAQSQGRLFLHRLVAPVTPDGFLLRGDSVPGPDPQYPPNALLGRFVRRGASFKPSFGFSGNHAASRTGLFADADRTLYPAALSRALGWILCHCSPVRRLALKLHQRRVSTRGFQTVGAL
jgi:hypothetical protein